jgi:hypothetical protein
MAKKRKPYSPIAPLDKLQDANVAIQAAVDNDSVGQLADAVKGHGVKVGYKAFVYLWTGRMTPAQMKPDEACSLAARLEAEGRNKEAKAIYQEVVLVHPDHPIASAKV